MSTSNSLPHSCVCDTLSNSPVDQLFQRSTDWPVMEVVEPPPYGEPEAAEVLRIDPKRHIWPVYLVLVPEDFEPKSWRTAPPNAQRFNNAITAAEVARMLNQHRIDKSKTGYVNNWHIRIKLGRKYAVVSITVPRPWKPKNSLDMPPAFIYLDGPTEECKHVIGELNNALFNEESTKRRRAYIGRSIDPETFEADDQSEKESEPTADELLKQHGLELHRTNGHSINRLAK